MPFGLSPIRFETLSNVTATPGPQDGELGDRVFYAGREYLRIFNAGTTAAVGYAMTPIANSTLLTCTVSTVTSADIPVGVVYHAAIPTENYGWLLTRGIGVVASPAGSAVAAGAVLEVQDNGAWGTVSNTTGNLGNAQAKALSAIACAATGKAYVSCY